MTLQKLAILAAIPLAIALNHLAFAMSHVIVIEGAEDDCMLRYGDRDLIDVYGIEIDGRHKVECRYR